MPITTTTLMPPAVQQSFSGKLLSVPTPSLIHKLPAMRKKMPAHGGDTLRMKRYNKLATAPVPLGNTGIEPPAQTLSAIFVDAKIDFYGKMCAVVKPILIARNPKHMLYSIRSYLRKVTYAWQLEGRFSLLCWIV